VRVALFVTCLADSVFPEVGRSVVSLLERLGYRVDFPQAQTCCGQMHLNSGYARESRAMMERFLDVFEDYDAIVTPSASCAGTVRVGYRDVAETLGHPGLRRRLDRLSGRVHELSEFLVDVLGVTDVGAFFPHRVTYHPTCHSLRVLQLGDRPLQLLQKVEGIELVQLQGAAECCGFGGTFALKNPAVSGAILENKLDAVRATGASYVCAVDASCLMQIGGGLSRAAADIRPIHLASVLASTERVAG
jgi:L-lactate dehydrogenase complex protein LldE